MAITDAFEEHPYDLLIVVPPHRGAQVVIDSGLAPRSGWLPTDRHTLQVKTVAKPAPGQADEDIPRYPNVYALGDATDLPLSKAGSTAHFEAPIVAERVAAAVAGSGAARRRTPATPARSCASSRSATARGRS